MKYRTTRKEVSNGYTNVFRCGYCELQPIERYLGAPVAYTCGVYGWNLDVYEISARRIAITTGYRSLVGRELPENAKNILRAAEQFSRENRDKRIGTSPAEYSKLLKNEEIYMQDAARRFVAALEDCGK